MEQQSSPYPMPCSWGWKTAKHTKQESHPSRVGHYKKSPCNEEAWPSPASEHGDRETHMQAWGCLPWALKRKHWLTEYLLALTRRLLLQWAAVQYGGETGLGGSEPFNLSGQHSRGDPVMRGQGRQFWGQEGERHSPTPQLPHINMGWVEMHPPPHTHTYQSLRPVRELTLWS